MTPFLRRWDRLPILTILCLALILRLHRLVAYGLWIDEGYSVSLASLPLPQILAGTAADQHPPLYYILLRGWMHIAGNSEFAVRFLSVGLGVLTVALVYTVGRRLFSAQLGGWAAFLLAISPFHIRYSGETRMYVLLALLSLASVYFMWTWLECPSLRRAGFYVITTALSLYTHNFAIFVLLFENAWVILWILFCGRRRMLKGWILIQASILILWLPWLPLLIRQTMEHRVSWIGKPTLDSLRSTFLVLTTGAQRAQPGGAPEFLNWLWILVMLAALGLTYRQHPARRRNLLLIVTWFLLPATIIVIAATQFPLYQDKQFLLLIPPLVLIFAAGLTALSARWRTVTVVALIALHAYPLYSFYYTWPHQDWRQAITYLNNQAQTGDAIILNPAAGTIMLDYYGVQDLPTIGIPQDYDILVGGFEGEIVTPTSTNAQLQPILDSYQRVWLLEFVPDFWDPQGLISSWLNAHSTPQPTPQFVELSLRLYEIDRTK